MIALALVLASGGDLDQLERCRAAVHGALETAVEICRPAERLVDLWRPETRAERCRPALERGVQAGKSGPRLPPQMRAGLIRHFDEAYAACTAPKDERELPRRNVPRLWD